MDCSTFVAYVYKVTLGLEMYGANEPWRVQNMHDDACKKDNKYFYFVYKQTPISQIDYSKYFFYMSDDMMKDVCIKLLLSYIF